MNVEKAWGFSSWFQSCTIVSICFSLVFADGLRTSGVYFDHPDVCYSLFHDRGPLLICFLS